MKGMPKWLNSKEDVYLVVQLAMEGQLDKTQAAKKIRDMLSDEKVYQFKAVVDVNYTPADGEKVLIERDYEGNEKIVCYELIDNPDARYLSMGLTKNELIELLNQLEEE